MEIGRQNIIILIWKYRGRAVSLLGIHKSGLEITIGFSLALHLQCKQCQPHRSPPAELGKTPNRAVPLALALLGRTKNLLSALQLRGAEIKILCTQSGGLYRKGEIIQRTPQNTKTHSQASIVHAVYRAFFSYYKLKTHFYGNYLMIIYLCILL